MCYSKLCRKGPESCDYSWASSLLKYCEVFISFLQWLNFFLDFNVYANRFMSCNHNYYATECLDKSLPMMNQSIEINESWAGLMCVYHFFCNKNDKYSTPKWNLNANIPNNFTTSLPTAFQYFHYFDSWCHVTIQ